VFASTVGGKVRGGYGVVNSVVDAAIGKAKQVPDGFHVQTGRCIA
jgi:hypothetical protein